MAAIYPDAPISCFYTLWRILDPTELMQASPTFSPANIIGNFPRFLRIRACPLHRNGLLHGVRDVRSGRPAQT